MKKIISIILAIFLLFCLPTYSFAFTADDATAATPWYGTCTGDGVRIRQSPSTSSSILGQLNRNTDVEVIGRSNSDWYKIRYTTSGSTGYISSQYITILKATYGYVLYIYGCPIRSSKSSTSTNLYTAPNDTRMPYKQLTYYNSKTWVNCVCGTTSGWVDTCDNYDFRYY